MGVPAGTDFGEHASSTDAVYTPPVRSVALMVCTRNRRGLLGEWLSAAARINSPAACPLYIVIADNNDVSDEAWIRDGARVHGLEIVYRYEPRTGFASARNAAVEAALTTDAEILIFVDDDDTPDPELVVAHVAAFERYGADIISGWIPERDKMMTEGRPANLISTGNAALRRWLVEDAGLRFDPRYNHVGGEDSAFFRAALGLGAKAVYSRSARVVTFQHLDPEARRLAATARARNKIHIRSLRGGKVAALSKYLRRYVPCLFGGLILIAVGRVFRILPIVDRGRELLSQHRFALQGLIHGGIDRSALKQGQILSAN